MNKSQRLLSLLESFEDKIKAFLNKKYKGKYQIEPDHWRHLHGQQVVFSWAIRVKKMYDIPNMLSDLHQAGFNAKEGEIGWHDSYTIIVKK